MTTNYSFSTQYEFDILPESLGFFKRKKLLNLKIDEKSDNTLFFINKNKILSVEVEEGCTSWLHYDKALFFYDLFNIKNKKYVLISENDNFFYGYIDDFPCVFSDNYLQATDILSQYTEGENIFQYGIGNVKLDCIKTKNFYQIYSMFDKSLNEPNSNCVMEEDTDYGSYSESKIIDSCLKWKYLMECETKRRIKMSSVWISLGLLFFFIAYFIG